MFPEQQVMKSLPNAAPPDSTALQCQLARDVLCFSGSLRIPAAGWSMFPAIRPGDILIVEPAAITHVRIGDIVVLEQAAKLICHRVRAFAHDFGGPSLITRGDTSPFPDPAVEEDKLLGRVAAIVREGKSVPMRDRLSLADNAIAKVVTHGFPVARALLQLRNRLPNPVRTREKAVSTCPS